MTGKVTMWDVCLVFPVKTKDKKDKEEKEEKEEDVEDEEEEVEDVEEGQQQQPRRKKSKIFKRIAKRLSEAGLSYVSYFSVQKDEIYVLIGASDKRLADQADILDFQVPLHPTRLATCLAEGLPEYQIAPIVLGTHADGMPVSKYAPTQHIYAKYDTNPTLVGLYKTTADDEATAAKSTTGAVADAATSLSRPFRSMQRIKLITYILQAKKQFAGCEIPLQKRINQGKILAFLPLHSGKELRKLKERWLETSFFEPSSYPFDDYKDYFGEAAGLYMKYVAFNARLFLVLGIPGVLIFAALEMIGSGPALGVVRAVYVVGLIIWCAIFSALWTRKQQQTALEWGTTGFERQEPPRPQHKGPIVKSPVTGNEEIYFHPRNRQKQVIFGVFISTLIVAIDLVFIIAVTVWRDSIGKQTPSKSTSAAAILSVGIQVFGFVYKAIAQKLTAAENWRTETEFSDNLVLKTVIFNFINSYFALLLTLFKPCSKPTQCVNLLRTNLLFIFVLQVIVNVAVSTLLPYAMRIYAQYTEGGLNDDVSFSAAEWQYVLLEYDETLDAIQAYMGMTIQFGYVALFSGAAPLVGLLAAGGNLVLLRLEARKYMTSFRRIEPRGAEDIGKFEAVVTILGILAPITNASIVITLSPPFSAIDPLSQRRYVYVIAAATAVVVQLILRAAFSGMDPDVDMQLERQSFIQDKVIKHVADEEELLSVTVVQPVSYDVKETADAYFDDLASVIDGGRGHPPSGSPGQQGVGATPV